MSATPEGNVKADIKEWLHEVGFWYLMPVKQSYGRVGIPDFIICAGGPFLAVEAKRPGNEDGCTPRQKEELQAVRDCGGRAFVCTSLEQLKDYCYADESIRAQLPSRSSPREPRAPRAAPRETESAVRIREKARQPANKRAG